MGPKFIKKLAIRVCTDSNYGKGHLTRCIAIRSFIKFKTTWYIDLKDHEIINMIPEKDKIVIEGNASSCIKIKSDIKKKNISMVLLDSSAISNVEYLKIKKNVPLVIISDLIKTINADLTIYPHPVSHQFSKKSNFLKGLKYSLIRKNYRSEYNFKDYKKKEFNILISMGAIDKAGVTLTAVKTVKKILRNTSYKLKIFIVLGSNSPLKTHVRSALNLEKSFKIVVNPKDMRFLYCKTTLAIGAPGQSQIERLVFGIPSILVSQNKIHKPLIRQWVKLGCSLQADNTVYSLYKKIYFLLSNRESLKKKQIKSKNIIDGLGALRVTSNMSKVILNDKISIH